MSNQKLTAQQKRVIRQIESNGFKKDEKNSGFDKESDGTSFYTFYAQHGMGAQIIQQDGKSIGGLLTQNK